MSCTIPLAYFFAIRRNVFKVSFLKSERQLVLSHLGKSLRMIETKVKLEDVEPVSRLNKNIRLLIHQRQTSTLDTIYLDRKGKYLNRSLLEDIAKGIFSPKPATPNPSLFTNNPTPTPGKYTINRKKMIKTDDATQS